MSNAGTSPLVFALEYYSSDNGWMGCFEHCVCHRSTLPLLTPVTWTNQVNVVYDPVSFKCVLCSYITEMPDYTFILWTVPNSYIFASLGQSVSRITQKVMYGFLWKACRDIPWKKKQLNFWRCVWCSEMYSVACCSTWLMEVLWTAWVAVVRSCRNEMPITRTPWWPACATRCRPRSLAIPLLSAQPALATVHCLPALWHRDDEIKSPWM